MRRLLEIGPKFNRNQVKMHAKQVYKVGKYKNSY